MRSSTCFAMKDQITREFHLPLLHTNIYYNNQLVEDGICIEDLGGYKAGVSILQMICTGLPELPVQDIVRPVQYQISAYEARHYNCVEGFKPW